MAFPSLSRRTTVVAGLAVLLLYVTWIGWPYFASIVVRDAAVTSWSTVAVSPIAGYTENLVYPGGRIGVDGRLATIADPHADRRDLAKERAEELRVEARVRAQEAQVAVLRDAVAGRSGHAAQFSSAATADAETAAAGAQRDVASLRLRLALAHDEESRIAALQQAGLASKAALDAARGATLELERENNGAETSLRRATGRHGAAMSGVFVGDSVDGNTLLQNVADARLRLAQAETALTLLRGERDAERDIVSATQQAYETSRSLDVLVPPRAMVWSLISGPGAPVQAGSGVATWVDCRTMLVDVAIPDVEVALLHPGAPADVIIEGEKGTRRGTVLLTRGAAGVLGTHDLAALAKGRRPGLGEVLVHLTPTASDIEHCDIGHAAYVDFPGVGFFDVMRARLRW
jgi:multidrug resistance efflux pump